MKNTNENTVEEERKLASIVFTDIKGYTALMENDEAKALKTVAIFEKITREICSKYNGNLINFMGDGALLIFDNCIDALDFAVEIQTRFIVDEKIQHRVGINTGEVVLKDGNVYGDSVNVAARIESLGVPGVVLISDTTLRLIKNKKKFSFKSMGKFHFKNKKDLMEVIAVTNEPLTIPQRKDLKGKTEEKKFSKWWLMVSIAAIFVLGFIGIQLSKNAISQVKTWEGTWDITAESDKNRIPGELKMNKSDNKLSGMATIWYNKAQDVYFDFKLENVVELKDQNKITGKYKSNILNPDTLRGIFELSMMPSFKEFEGIFLTSDGKPSFQWKGTRK
jgi:class 3 adenylate cyclase